MSHASIPNRLIECEFDPSHSSGHGLGGVSSCSQFRHQPAKLFVGKPRQGDVANPGCNAFVAEKIGFDRTGTQMRPVGDDLQGVVGPCNVPLVGVDPLAPVELRQLGS